MMDALIHAFVTSNLPLSAEEIADVVWLASYADIPASTSPVVAESDPLSKPSTQDDTPNPRSSLPIDPQPTQPSKGSSAPAEVEVHLPKPSNSENQSVDGVRALPFRSPAATALPGKLALIRALRPLLRKIPSSTIQELDEVATVEQAADERRITPRLRPSRERWLDVAVVVDDWHTMLVWQQTIAEFIELLQQLGAFRTVQIYLLSTTIATTTDEATFHLHAAQGANFKRGRTCHPGELTDARGRRLILVLSDCTSPVWSNGVVGRLLSMWGKSNMVALLQMLPADLWNSCALADAIQIAVSSVTPGLQNARLRIERPWYWDDIWDETRTPDSLSPPVPVITLEPESLRSWTKVMIGKGGSKLPAFYLSTQPVPLSNQNIQVKQEELSPEERWRQFRATASPMAQELAGYLSAAPLSLPVMRLVQHVMLPQSRQVHLAEVLRSQLICFVAEHDGMFEPDIICYEFVGEVRQLLLTSILLSDTQRVLEKTSEYIGKYSEQLRQFHALILDPTASGEFRIDNDNLPFAQIATVVLRRLGGKYTQLTKYLEDNIELVGTTPNPDTVFNLLIPDVPCPYRGFEFFNVQHAANYFGRQEMTAKLVAKVQECNFIAVVGPSGSGKSSLVRAGLMVALQKGAITGSGDWKLEIFRPGENPLQSLAGALLRLNPALSDVDRWMEIEKLGKRLGNGKLSIGSVLDQLRGSIPKLLLIVDQFEETFTLCSDDTLRNAFLDTLLAATDPKTGKPWLTVIFTLRADFFGRVLEREALSKRVDDGLVNVLPMTHEERRAAIEQPALQAGRSFESGMVERILDAVEAEPGQLPLLEFAMTELWARQSAEGTLTHAAYEEIGEVSGAIAKRADETLRSLPKADQERVRTIFTRLVRVASPDGVNDDTKRCLRLDEMDPSLGPLIQFLADARLLVTGRDEQQNSITVEVAHEALIRRWGALQTWLNSDREFLLWRQRLQGFVENWIAFNKDEASLIRGVTLSESQGWLAARSSELTSLERQFIEASIASSQASQQEIDILRRRVKELEHLNETTLNPTVGNESTIGSSFRNLWKRLRGES